MAKRIFLDIHNESSSYTLVGLSTQLKDYHLSFLLNKIPGLQFARFEDLPVLFPDLETPAAYSLFTSSDEEAFNTYYLISNRNQDHFLVPSLKQTDYLMIIEGPFKKKQKDELLKALRAIPNLLLAVEVNPTTIKQFESLITDLEIHIMNVTKHSIRELS
ncbi:MAG: IPExxxVDY family protein [Bacteroidetes bacterium]|nr:IPExxxVDY family protein [Bacteroidota bacterium]